MLLSPAIGLVLLSTVALSLPVEKESQQQQQLLLQAAADDECGETDLLGLCEDDRELRRGLSEQELALLEDYITAFAHSGAHDLPSLRKQSPLLARKIEHYARAGEARVAAVGEDARAAIAFMQDYFRALETGELTKEQDDAMYELVLARFAKLSVGAHLRMARHFPKLARFVEAELAQLL